jgi:hypothetical protein
MTRVLIKSWLNLQVVANVAGEEAERLLNTSVTPRLLERFDALRGKTVALLNHASKCSNDPYPCVAKQWNKPVEHQTVLFGKASAALNSLRNKLETMHDSSLNSNTALQNFETQLNHIVDTLLKPAQCLDAFTFHFNGVVVSQHDHWHAKKGTRFNNVEFTIDPNRMDFNEKITMSQVIHLENGHANCRNYHGTLSAYYEAGKLYVTEDWHRHCGGHSTETQTFSPEGSQTSNPRYRAVQTDYSFAVTFAGCISSSSLTTQNSTGGERRLVALV